MLRLLIRAIPSSQTGIIHGTEKEALLFMRSTRDKEEYRRAYAVKQKMEGLPYMTIAKVIGINYRSVYNWIDNYIKHDLLYGIKNKRKNGDKRPVVSTTRTKR